MDLCAHLRWKSFYARDWRTDDELVAVFERNEVPYSCLRSCRPWGPDGEPAAPEGCNAERPCYEPSARPGVA